MIQRGWMKDGKGRHSYGAISLPIALLLPLLAMGNPAPPNPIGPAPSTCNNGRLDSSKGEKCDGTLYGQSNKDCLSLGYDGGVLSCTNCQLDIKNCLINSPPSGCGDGVVQPAETCDGTNFGGRSCTTFGMGSGQLTCLSNCRASTLTCSLLTLPIPQVVPSPPVPTPPVAQPICNQNNIREGTEICDGQDFGSRTCQTSGLGAGTLVCKPGCILDTSQCSSAPRAPPAAIPADDDDSGPPPPSEDDDAHHHTPQTPAVACAGCVQDVCYTEACASHTAGHSPKCTGLPSFKPDGHECGEGKTCKLGQCIGFNVPFVSRCGQCGELPEEERECAENICNPMTSRCHKFPKHEGECEGGKCVAGVCFKSKSCSSNADCTVGLTSCIGSATCEEGRCNFKDFTSGNSCTGGTCFKGVCASPDMIQKAELIENKILDLPHKLKEKVKDLFEDDDVDEDSGLSSETITWITLAGVVVFAFVGFALYKATKKNTSKSSRKSVGYNGYEYDQPVASYSASQPAYSSQPVGPSYDAYDASSYGYTNASYY